MWFDLAQYAVPTGALFGGTDTSCAVKKMVAPQAASNRPYPSGKNRQAVYDKIMNVLSTGAALNLSETNNLAITSLQGIVTPGRQKQVAKEVLNKLIDDHYLLLTDGMVTLPP